MPRQDPLITAKVICDSINKHGNRLTTMVITYPRIIMAEFNTHRAFSRSSASSRAIPLSRQIEKTKRNTFYPSFVGMNEPGMQASAELSPENEDRFRQEWLIAASVMCGIAETADKLSVHKQIANRLLEPFQYVTTIVTATEWTNFFKLRCHPDAQPEMMVLAFKMLSAYLESKPEKTEDHIPFGDQMDQGLSTEEKRLVACARCARISYDNFDGSRDAQADLKLANRLMSSGHMSPFEHVARAHVSDTYVGNFRGWVQQRKRIAGENVISLDLEKLMLTKPSWV